MLGVECRVLGVGCWVLDVGCWVSSRMVSTCSKNLRLALLARPGDSAPVFGPVDNPRGVSDTGEARPARGVSAGEK